MGEVIKVEVVALPEEEEVHGEEVEEDNFKDADQNQEKPRRRGTTTLCPKPLTVTPKQVTWSITESRAVSSVLAPFTLGIGGLRA